MSQVFILGTGGKRAKLSPLAVTENGTYIPSGIDGYNSVTVNVPSSGGGGSTAEDVTFFDCDGTVLHTYALDEIQEMEQLPELPSRSGLICQGWNLTLEELKAHNRAANVGAVYITDDGKTRLYVKVAQETGTTVRLGFSQTLAYGVTVDWGDGTPAQTFSGTGGKVASHDYSQPADYVITLDVADGCTLGLGTNDGSDVMDGSAANRCLLKKAELGNGVTSIGSYAFRYCYSLTSVTIPEGVTSIGSNAFQYCYSLTSVTLPDGVTRIDNNAFYQCYSLTSVTLPDGVTRIGDYAFQYCYSLASVTLPDGVISIGPGAFYSCSSLTSITIPGSVTSIGNNAFSGCSGMKYYDFTEHTSVPALSNTGAFSSIPAGCEIRVPAALYDEWIAATNWATYARYIVAV